MAGGDHVKLLGLPASLFAVRAIAALNLKGVSFEYIDEDLSNKSELLLRSNPVHKKVPVLLHNGNPVCESSIILQYIDEVWSSTGPALLPADPYDRAIARFWATYVDDKMYPAVVGIMLGATEEERTAKAKEISTVTEVLEGAFSQCSNEKDFFHGDSIGFVDLVLGSYLPWLEALRRLLGVAFIGVGKSPLLDAWADRFGETSEGKKVLEKVDVMIEYTKTRLAEVDAANATK